MIKFLTRSLLVLSGCLAAVAAHAAPVTWTGSVSDDAANGANWTGGVAPTAADEAIIPFTGNTPDTFGGTVSYDQLTLQNAISGINDTGGGGTINLANTGISLFSGGSANSVVVPNINASGEIQTNGDHSVTFNGAVTARKLTAFATSVATYNGSVNISDGFITGSGEVILNGPITWGVVEKGFNGGGTLAFGSGAVASLGILNLFDGGTIRADDDFAITGATDVWARHATGTLDLNGFSQSVEFIGTNFGSEMTIDFGANPGANTLIWDASHNSNGTYAVVNFEPGIDVLELGQFGANSFINPSKLMQLTVNGAEYSMTDPGNGMDWWTAVPTANPTDNPNRQVIVFNSAQTVPEPSTLVGLATAAILLGLRRKRGTIG